MTDHHERDDVELASAYLDGAATTDERERVESDAALLALVDRMRRVRSAVAEVAPAPESGRERAIAAALHEFDTSSAGVAASEPTPPANVVPLDRRRRLSALQGLTAAAAAVLIVVGGFVLAGQGDNDDDSSIARDADPATTTATAATAATAPAETVDEMTTTTTTNAPAVLEAVVTAAGDTSTPAAHEAAAEVAAQVAAPAAAPTTTAPCSPTPSRRRPLAHRCSATPTGCGHSPSR